jgi:hypothetical protein
MALQKPVPIVDVVPPQDHTKGYQGVGNEDYEDYTMQVVPLSRPDQVDDVDGNWQWCLLTFAGNATILQLRREDFVRYLKMNLASLIGEL